MALKIILIIVLISAMTNAGLIPAVEVLQGPSSKTTLVGPDGSTLSAAAPGGTLVTGSLGTGLVAGLPLGLVAGPEVIVAGPSGSIVTSNTLAGPAVIPVAVVSAPDDTESPIDTNTDLPENTESNEGAYVPDNTEQLYDDGSYKSES